MSAREELEAASEGLAQELAVLLAELDDKVVPRFHHVTEARAALRCILTRRDLLVALLTEEGALEAISQDRVIWDMDHRDGPLYRRPNKDPEV